MEITATPEVSVITAFFNEERFLKEAVESVIAQTFTNWELVLIDDGSTDHSTQIARYYAQAYPDKILYFEHEEHANKSTAASRNLAISKARGALVAFLDADDVWLPGKLENQVKIMQEHPAISMLLEASEYWYSWEDVNRHNATIQVGGEKNKILTPPALAETLYPLTKNAAPCPSAIMVRSTPLKLHGGFEAGFTGKYQLYEDQAFLMKFYLNEPIYISPLCNNKYRQRTGSCVQRVTNEGSYDVVRKYFLSWMSGYMESHKIHHKKVNRLFRKALDQYERPFIYYIQYKLFNM